VTAGGEREGRGERRLGHALAVDAHGSVGDVRLQAEVRKAAAVRRQQLELEGELLIAGDGDLLARRGVLLQDGANHVRAGGDPEWLEKGRFSGGHAIHLEARSFRLGGHAYPRNSRGLLRVHGPRPCQLDRLECVSRLERALESSCRVHRAVQRRVDEPDVVREQNVRRDLVCPQELRERPRVVLRVEQLEAAIEALSGLLARCLR
jgi:hypothetical protein